MEPRASSASAVDRLVILLLLMTATIRGMVQEKNALLGNTAVLECIGNSTGSELYVVWTLANGTQFHHYSLSTKRKQAASEFCPVEKFCSIITEDENGAFLEINEVDFKDVGNYNCLKIFMILGSSETIQFSLQVQDYPRLLPQVSNSTEKRLSADCCVNISLNMEDYFLQWLVDGDSNFPIVIQKEKKTTSERRKSICSFIKFERKRHYHRKTLECLLKNEDSVISSASTQLDVWYAARVMAGELSNTWTPFLVDINAEFNITCVADGNPLPIVQLEMLTSENKWIKFENTSQSLEARHNSWTFLHRGIEKDTTFRCIADNLFDQNAVSDNIFVEVMYLNGVKMLSKTLKIARDSEFNISCQTDGKPRPLVHLLRRSGSSGWEKVNVTPIIVTQDKHTATVNFLLTTDDSKADGYTFKCKAFKSPTNKTVESSEVRLEILPTLLELVKTNLNSIVIVGVGLVIIIAIIATGVSRHNKQVARSTERKEQTTYSDIKEGGRTSTETENTLLNNTDVQRTSANPTLMKVDEESSTYPVVPLYSRDIPGSCSFGDDYTEML